MKKYDCEKTRDFMHEWMRYHKASENDKFPIITSWEPASIEVLQRWSDEHPEAPKITPEDLAFIKAFKIKDSKYIERRHGRLYVISMYGFQEFEIWPNMFPFIEEGQHVGFPDLLRLEVEE